MINLEYYYVSRNHLLGFILQEDCANIGIPSLTVHASSLVEGTSCHVVKVAQSPLGDICCVKAARVGCHHSISREN